MRRVELQKIFAEVKTEAHVRRAPEDPGQAIGVRVLVVGEIRPLGHGLARSDELGGVGQPVVRDTGSATQKMQRDG